MPDLEWEQSFEGLICGLDEVGRGPLAGPVVAACVHIPPAIYALPFVSQIKDSKKLSPKKLDALYDHITESCVWAVAEVSPQLIDEINILQASLRAMEMALAHTKTSFAHALVDGNKLPQLPCPASAIIKGDSKSTSIAAASIVAKVTRDRVMHRLHEEYPLYGWDQNVGYPTAQHLAAIERLGITPHHRRSFAPVRQQILKRA
jgi:ribonuclease HII